MNWIGGRVQVSIDDLDAGDVQMDDFLNYRRESEGERQLGLLREALSKTYWDFSLGTGQFDGISEGICYLIGIVPSRSMSAGGDLHNRLEYGPSFLPGGLLYNWGTDIPTSNDYSNLRGQIHESADLFKRLRLLGLQNVQHVIGIARKYELNIPWWRQANNDLACAKRLPALLRENFEIAKRIKSEQTRSAANRRIKKDQKSDLISVECRREFEEIFASPPDAVLARGTGKLKALSTAKIIWQSQTNNVSHGRVPSPETIAKHIRLWLMQKK